MTFKKIILFVASCLIILIFFHTEFYGNWFETKIYRAWDSEIERETFDYQRTHLNPEQRKIDKLQETYTFSEQVAAYLKQMKAKNPLVLLPPQEYINEKGGNMIIPEPIVFYYHCGVKGAWYTSANVNQTNWAIIVQPPNGITPQQLAIIPIQNQPERDAIIAVYKHAVDSVKARQQANSPK